MKRKPKSALRRLWVCGGGRMSKRIGAQTTALPSCPGLIGWAGIAGQKEKEGPYGAKFDWIIPDELNGEKSFESAERGFCRCRRLASGS